MGYRSEVAFACTHEVHALIVKRLEEHGGIDQAVIDVWKNPEIKDRYGVAFHEEWMKWYRDYDDVNIIMDVLENADWDHVRFARVGEDSDDIETFGWYADTAEIMLNFTIDVTPT